MELLLSIVFWAIVITATLFVIGGCITLVCIFVQFAYEALKR